VFEVSTTPHSHQGLTRRIKLVSAAVGAGALVTMGALSAAISGPAAQADEGPGGAGETTTKSKAPTQLETPSAAPLVKAEPFAP
jgi:hypothetical protein